MPGVDEGLITPSKGVDIIDIFWDIQGFFGIFPKTCTGLFHSYLPLGRVFPLGAFK